MSRQASKTGSNSVYWLFSVLLIMTVGLADAALIAAVSSLITVVQLMVIAFTVALIDGGVFITARQMSQVE
jgi:hypothetical protein